jgi:hypothetical protein
MFKSIIFFATSVLLLFIGYNFIFNTRETIAKYVSFTKYREGSYMYKLLTSESNVVWLKVVGGVVTIFALILLGSLIIMFLNKQVK